MEVHLINNGIKSVTLGDEDMAAFYEGRYNIDMATNQYLFIKNIENQVVDKMKWNGECLTALKFKSIINSRFGKIKPVNDEQQALFDLLQNERITVKVVTGVAGGGKNYCAFTYALDAVDRGYYNKIVMVRNNIEVRDSNPIGALPAGINEKLLPYAMPAADLLGSPVELFHLIETNKIEILHLGFARGRSFDNTIIIVDEAANLTLEHTALLISRVGKNSIIIFLGDTWQVDKEVFRKNSGLERMARALFGNSLYGSVALTKTERSETAKLSELLY